MTKRGLNYFSYLIFKNPDTERHPDVQNSVCQKKDDGSGRDENVERGNWASKREYILSMIGYAVGLGNVWRFPYLAYRNGGGAFLIPYFIMLMVAGLPVFLMECSLGQFCSQGPINVWMAVPIMQGVGITMVLVSSLVAIYYNVIIAYSIYYMFASFQSPLPWSNYAVWSDENCSLTPRDDGSSMVNMTEQNTTFSRANISSVPMQNPSERYWNEVVLQRSGGLGETGEIVWPLGLCLLLAWVLIGGALYKGIKSSGKVVYFTATFPYVVLFILLVRGLTLEGARDGIQYYIGSQSNLTKLMEAEVWRDAATQIFYSLSVAWGGLTALSSYNKFKNNCYKDSIIVCLTNCGTSIFAGFAIFSILGHMAHVYEKPVPEVVESDDDAVYLRLYLLLELSPFLLPVVPSLPYKGSVAQDPTSSFALAFVAYPEALSKLPVSPLWSILFFFMLLTLGLDSQFASIETITTSIQDAFPRLFRSKRFHITVATCAILFLIGLPCVTRAGIYWVKLLDHFCAGWILLVTALLEIIGLSYIYGANRFIKDIEMMIGTRSALFWLWWRACWLFITPCVLSVILVWSLSSFTPPTYGSVVYPRWGLSLGWCLLTFCLIWIPIVSMWKLWKADGSLWQRCKVVCTPTDKWGPYLEIHRTERYAQRHALQISPSIEMSAPSAVSSTSCGLDTPSEPLNYTLF